MKDLGFPLVFAVLSGVVASCSEDRAEVRSSDAGSSDARAIHLGDGKVSQDESPAPDGSVCPTADCGGECTSGRCLSSLATRASRGALAVDGTNVYFARCSGETGEVLAVPLGGGSAVTLASVQGCPVALVATSSRLFVACSSPAAVLAFRLGSDGGLVETLAPGADAVGLAVDQTNVYFTTLGGSLFGVPVGGGAVATLVTGRTRLTSPAVDDTGVYFGDAERGTIERVSPTGGAGSTILTSGVGAVSALALGSSDVYFGAGYLVMKVPKAGGVPITLGTAAGAEVLAVALDETSFYFSGYGSVWKMPLEGNGGPAELLAADQSEARAIAVDATSVYFTNDSGVHPDGGNCCSAVLKLTPK